MTETIYCLSGHEAFIRNFGRDTSRATGLNPYCKDCVRNRIYAQRRLKKQYGLSALARKEELKQAMPESYLTRHEQKRQQEHEIELQLKQQERERERIDPLPPPHFDFLRQPQKRIRRLWECPVGMCSKF